VEGHLSPHPPFLTSPQIFSDLDTQDEADMLNLACFMQTLLDWVPGNQESEPVRQISVDMDEDHMTNASDLEGSIALDSIQLSVGNNNIHGDINDYVLPKGSLTADVAQNIIQVYRKQGRLNIKSVQKILRVVYKSLKDRPNISEITIKRGEKLTVVGDIHGQLADLFHILDESGWPSATNKYVFNGDFVDRGIQGIEVVCVLLALFAAMPEYVFLNRGNHEDHAICCVYGFQRECKEKYDELTFGMFVEVFRHIPLFAVVNDALFIVHGGLFHDVNAKLQDLKDIDRSDYTAKPPIPYPDCTEGMTANDSRKEYLKQLQRDALWSDPNDMEVLAKNQRGSGVVFGPEVTKRFLTNNGLSMIIRSHECVREGFDLPYSGNAKHLLGTIFSASNYCGGQNEGAYLVFALHRMTNSTHVPGSDLFYTIHQYQMSEAEKSLQESNKMSLHELINRRKKALTQAFETADADGTGRITKMAWADIMQRVTLLKILWLGTLNTLCPACVCGNLIDYRTFLNSFSLHTAAAAADGASADANVLSMDSMYGQRTKLEAVFRFFDKNGDGAISRAEFRLGCDFMNTTLPPDQQLRDYDHVLSLMDFDQSDSIDINEFFEVPSPSLHRFLLTSAPPQVFRLLDAKDGVVDGVLSLAERVK
jgi:serine/threonine-protein phosphatase with EF-hands